MRDFLTIALEAGTDKVTHHNYQGVYPRYLDDRREESLVLIEIGVAEGRSLRMWEEYLPNAEIHGIDKQPEHFVGKPRRSQLHKANVLTIADYSHIPPPDVVVDDGGHHKREQARAFKMLWPRLRSGGLYFIEDLGERRRGKSFTVDLGVMVTDILLRERDDIAFLHAYPEMVVFQKA